MILQTVFLFSNSEIYCAPIQKNSKSKSSVKSIQNTMPIYNDGIVNITLEAIPINIGPKGAEDWGLNKYKNTALGSGGEAKFVIHTEGLSSGAEIIFPLLITLYDMVGSNDNKPEEFSANVATPGVGYRFVGGIRKELTNPKNIVFLELKDGVEIKVKDLKSPDNVDAPLRGADVNVIADLLLDLRIYNGGGDLDNGENLSGNSGYDPSIPLNEDKEEFEGACVLVNWDNDNKFGVNFNNLNRIDNPKPDLSKSTKTNNEDNLTKIDLIIHPFLKKVGGQIKIAVTKGADKIKFWKNKDKSGGSANGWINKKFSVNDPKLPSSIWIEGVKKSASQKDIEIQLQYTGILGNLKDVVKLTCVMIRLGNAAYRDLNLTGTQHFGHAALTYRYNSKAHLFDLLNADNFDIMEMMNGVPALQVNQLSSLINLGPWGCFTNAQYLPDNDAGYKNRLIVLARMRKIELRNQKNYSDFEYTKMVVLKPENIRWQGVLSHLADESIDDKDLHRQITHLRCDGLVEYAYESVNIPIWQRFWWKIDVLEDNFHLQWRRGVYRRIQGANNYGDALEDHNVNKWGASSYISSFLYPATQCGRIAPQNSSTTFTGQILCDPIGHRGGN